MAAGLEPIPPARPRPPRPLVLINCSAAKLSTRARAFDLYDPSAFFRAARSAALKLNPAGWWIISARHGLVHPDTWLDPYDVRIGEPGAMDADALALTVPDELLHNPAGVVALTTSAYTRAARTIWPELVAPLEHAAPEGRRNGIGWMRQRLGLIAETGSLERAATVLTGAET